MLYEKSEIKEPTCSQPFFRPNSMSCVTLHNTEYDCFMSLDGNNEFDLSKNRSCHDFEFFEKQQVAISCRRV